MMTTANHLYGIALLLHLAPCTLHLISPCLLPLASFPFPLASYTLYLISLDPRQIAVKSSNQETCWNNQRLTINYVRYTK
jgi:hypothetical protein